MTRSKTELIEAIHLRTGQDKEELAKLQKFKLCMILDDLRESEEAAQQHKVSSSDDEASADLAHRIGVMVKIKSLKKE